MRVFVPLLLALCSGLACAQLYSWKDAQGKTHYSDQPPPADAATRKLAPLPPAAGAGEQRKVQAEKRMDAKAQDKEAQDKVAKAEKDRADAAVRKENCDRARATLQSIESGQVRFTVDSSGNRIALDGATRDAEVARARQSADSWCK